jgi:hypothetical protein
MPGYCWFPQAFLAAALNTPHHPTCSPFMPFHLTTVGGI